MHIEIPDRHHLAMRGRVLLLLAEIATAGEHLAITHDHRAEGVMAECGFCNGHAHEACVSASVAALRYCGQLRAWQSAARERRSRLRPSGACLRPAANSIDFPLHVLPSTSFLLAGT